MSPVWRLSSWESAYAMTDESVYMVGIVGAGLYLSAAALASTPLALASLLVESLA